LELFELSPQTRERTDDFNKVVRVGELGKSEGLSVKCVEKQGFWNPAWRKRYFVLKKGSLYYFKEKGVCIINETVSQIKGGSSCRYHQFGGCLCYILSGKY
jgi:hypothetical protein